MEGEEAVGKGWILRALNGENGKRGGDGEAKDESLHGNIAEKYYSRA